MNTPLISICIPAYKRPDCLIRLLNSIHEQTYKQYEIIITDDSPGDQIRQVLEPFTDLPIQYYSNKPALGSPGNWNYAMSKANGEWIHLLHADDWYASPTSLQHFVNVITEGNSDFIFCASKEINLATNSIKNMELTEKKRELLDGSPINLLFDNVIGHPSTVIHKKDTSIQYDTAFKWVVDIDFYIRYLQHHGGYSYIHAPMINISMDTEQVSESSYKNPFVEIPEYLNLFNKFSETLTRTNKFAFHCLWNLIRKFKIKDGAYIREHGYHGKMIQGVADIINYQKKIPRIILKQTNWSVYFMNKCYRSFTKK